MSRVLREMSENTKAELDELLDSFITYPPWTDTTEPNTSSWDAANYTFCESSSALRTLPSGQPVGDRHLHEPSIHSNGVNMNGIHVNCGNTSDVVHQNVYMNGGNVSNFEHRSVHMNGVNASDFVHQSEHMNGGNASDFVHQSGHVNGGNASDFVHHSVHMNCGNTSDFVHQDLQQGPNQYYHQNQISVLAYQENAVDNRQFGAGNGYMTGTNNTDPLVYSQPLEQSHQTQLPAMWQPNYMTVPPLQMDQVNMHNFGLQGEYVPNNATDILGTSYPGDELLQPAILPQCHNNLQEQDMHSHTSLTTDPPVNNIPGNGYFHPHTQLPQFGNGNVVGQCTNHYSVAQQQAAQANGNGPPNGGPKPRVRARRGQATDPHSIAERLRREKIADRMKNLQELVPNSTKLDKASMLDEIIDYVKFLQLQVKVLSTSRVSKNDAAAVSVEDLQHEEVDNYQSLPSSELGSDDSDSDDYAAFEQEVVKLMESDVTTAMQILQNKGLCLMPTTLATAIANKKGSVAAIPPNKRKDAHPPVNSQNNETTTRSNDRGNRRNETVVKLENLQGSSGNGR